MTETRKLAEEYLRLGGRRKSKIDDNIVNTRLWEDEPAEASKFWATISNHSTRSGAGTSKPSFRASMRLEAS